jgi:capsular exopolysaccharide synthesis family protein
MSKIFEALKKNGGEVAEVALPLVAGNERQMGGADVVESILRETESGGSPAVSSLLTELPPVTADAAPAPEATAHIHGPDIIPRMRTVSIQLSEDSPVLPFDTEHQRAGEQYRMARTKLLHHPLKPRLVVISSAGSGDGKTVTAINLAGAMALKSEAEILLVDGDLRRSQIAPLLGIPNTPGLADVLGGHCQLEDAIVRLEQFPNLCILPGGKPTANPTELLDSNRWLVLCAAVREQFKYVIFDAPPIAAVADYELIQTHCDGVVLVVRPDHTDRKRCLEALKIVPKERLIGVVMNCVRDWFLWKTQDYYAYGREI